MGYTFKVQTYDESKPKVKNSEIKPKTTKKLKKNINYRYAIKERKITKDYFWQHTFANERGQDIKTSSSNSFINC